MDKNPNFHALDKDPKFLSLIKTIEESDIYRKMLASLALYPDLRPPEGTKMYPTPGLYEEFERMAEGCPSNIHEMASPPEWLVVFHKNSWVTDPKNIFKKTPRNDPTNLHPDLDEKRE